MSMISCGIVAMWNFIYSGSGRAFFRLNKIISAKTYFASGVDTALLNRHLAVVMVAVGVAIVPA